MKSITFLLKVLSFPCCSQHSKGLTKLIPEGDDEYVYWKASAGREMKKRLGLNVNPLDGANYRTSKVQYMFQYFLKVVSTQFRTLDGKIVCCLLDNFS
jgi:hypothetical protein